MSRNHFSGRGRENCWFFPSILHGSTSLYHVCVLSPFSYVWLCVTLWTVAGQALLSMGFSRQEYWSGLSCPLPGDLPDPGSNPRLASPALAGRFFTTNTTWEALNETLTPLYFQIISWICKAVLRDWSQSIASDSAYFGSGVEWDFLWIWLSQTWVS